MRVRLLDAEVQKIVTALKNTTDELGYAVQKVTGHSITDVDDTSIQTIETLVFFCDGCNTWDVMENLGPGGTFCAGCDHAWSAASYYLDEGLQEIPLY